MEQRTNRLKVVLVERNKTSKWLAETLNMNPATISRWCSNKTQPSLDTLSEIAKVLDVDIRGLLVPTKKGKTKDK
ncbi:MAG: helix-turn-helix transcriptional regulator [Bacteroidales bacterium]|jgi:transcriptional regulator with XRE-family HTH domain|nr:helix-turn-helix transcriptional regulator [Bacteroidales bacterium]